MVRYWILMIFSFSAAWGFSGARPKATSSGTLRVYFAGNREGELEPCGCQVHQYGGLDRLVTYFSREDVGRDAKIFVESGDSFFSLPEMAPGRLEREKLKALLMANVFRRLSLDAFTPGERDFAAGLDFVKDLEKASGAVFLAANLTTADGKKPFAGDRLIERAGLRIGVIGIVGREALSHVSGLKIGDPAEAVKTSVAALRDARADAIVVLSHQGLEADRVIAALDGVDLVVGAHSLDAQPEPVRVGGAAIVQTQNQGQQIGKIRLKLPLREWLDHVALNLDSDLPSDPAVKKSIEDYKEAVRQIALRQSDQVGPPSTDRPFVAQSANCKVCHAKQYEFWKETKHSSAILVLYSKNQHFDPECIGCHSLGFTMPGGFSNVTKPMEVDGGQRKTKGSFVETFLKGVFTTDPGKGPLDSRRDPARHGKLHRAYWSAIEKLDEAGRLSRNYLGVQCEHCHGNRNGHPSEGVATRKKVNESTCKGCHTPPHAAPFDLKMFPRVACPLSSRG